MIAVEMPPDGPRRLMGWYCPVWWEDTIMDGLDCHPWEVPPTRARPWFRRADGVTLHLDFGHTRTDERGHELVRVRLCAPADRRTLRPPEAILGWARKGLGFPLKYCYYQPYTPGGLEAIAAEIQPLFGPRGLTWEPRRYGSGDYDRYQPVLPYRLALTPQDRTMQARHAGHILLALLLGDLLLLLGLPSSPGAPFLLLSPVLVGIAGTLVIFLFEGVARLWRDGGPLPGQFREVCRRTYHRLTAGEI